MATAAAPGFNEASFGFGTPFAEQLAFFRRKLNLPTERWDDIMRAAHDRAFIVAGAAKADLLQDLRGAVDKAMETGSLAGFRKDFKALVARNGWTGWTGEGSAKGQAWRTRVIYQTNMATSYAAGRRRQMDDPEFAAARPYWKYVHMEGQRYPRPQHQAWNGLTLPREHEFWKTHFAPNGWGCRCEIHPVKAPGPGDATRPPAGWKEPDSKTGAPKGIDRGFDYAPGANEATPLQALVDQKLFKLDGAIGRQMLRELEPVLAAERQRAAVVAAVAPAAQAPAAAVAAQGPRPAVFEAQPSAKAAGEWAMKNNLVDQADYAGIKPEVANAWNESLFRHLQEFPELRANQRFTGTAQAQMALWREKTIQANLDRLRTSRPDLDEAMLRARLEQQVKARKIDSRVWAHSTRDPTVSGVAVNKKWGADVDGWKRSLAANVQARFHPPGCDTIRSVIDHELGHQLDSLLSLAQDAEVKAAFNEARSHGMQLQVSKYAGTNIQEFIAEAWAESLNNQAPRTYAARIAAIVRDRYAAKFPAAGSSARPAGS